MKPILIETPRLYLRAFIEKDLPQLHEFYGDEKVMRFIGKGVRTEEETKQKLDRFIGDWRKYNLSPFAVIHKQTGNLIGRSEPGRTQNIKSYTTCRGEWPFAPTRYGGSA